MKRLVRFFLYKIGPPYWQDNLALGIYGLAISSITIWGAWRWLILDANKLWLIGVAVGIFIAVASVLFIINAFYLRRWRRWLKK